MTVTKKITWEKKKKKMMRRIRMMRMRNRTKKKVRNFKLLAVY